MLSKADFRKFSDLVIDNLEGGYYHPRFFYSLSDPRYSTSGETMYGIDRKNAGTIINTPEGKEFWQIIDQNSNSWKWNYFGGPVEERLKDLAASIMYGPFQTYSNIWLSEEAREKIKLDDRLLLHFVYATWNGPGWFRKFARDINKKANQPIEELIKQAIDSRTKEGLLPGSRPNSLIKQTGEKLNRIFKNITTPIRTTPGSGFIGILLAASLIVSLLIIRKNYAS
jgi:hypothetical protein